MARLRDIMTRDVVSVPPDLSVRDAMSLLASRHISGVPVVEGTRVVGVVTSTDLMALAAERNFEPGNRGAGVDDLRTQNQDGAGDELLSTFTALWDDAGSDVMHRFARARAAEWNSLDEHTVEEAMTCAPVGSLPADTTIPTAAEFMRRHGIHRVLVTEGGEYVGIATATDVVKAVAAHRVRHRAAVDGRASPANDYNWRKDWRLAESLE